MNIRYPIYEGVYRILTVLNPFAGITLLYLHDSFPFIEAYSVPHCTPANQPESNPLITP